MRRWARFATLAALLLPALAAGTDGAPVTRTGWFADEKCATARSKDGRVGPPGRTCTQECIRKGVKVVFIDEKTKELFRVENPALTKGQESDHVEIRAVLDPGGKTLRVESVKVLEKYVAKCSVQ